MTVISSDSTVVVYDGAVTRDDVNGINTDLDGLLGRVTPLFYRTESRRHAEQYLRGLLAPLQRKNGWTIAEHVGEREPKALQRFLNLTPWNVQELLALNRDYAMEHLASESGHSGRGPDRFREEGQEIRRGPTSILGDPGPDRQLPDRHVPGVRHARPGPGAAGPAALPAEGFLAGRSRTLRGSRGARKTSPSRPGRSRSSR